MSQTEINRLQAIAYVKRVGVDEAKRSSHYDTARRHCKCRECFCCMVKQVVDALQRNPR